MKSIITVKDTSIGKIFVVVSKIRDVHKAFGNVIISFDNGDKITINSDNSDELINDILKSIEEFYQK
jgi:hypothetical protein